MTESFALLIDSINLDAFFETVRLLSSLISNISKHWDISSRLQISWSFAAVIVTISELTLYSLLNDNSPSSERSKMNTDEILSKITAICFVLFKATS